MSTRTRFAPSPTGYLHIGGVRTALFNWLLARRHNGQFILRIDDTDQQRNVEAALQPILDGFRWLKLDWDEGPGVGGPHAPYYQSQRAERYQQAVDQLLARDWAYRDFATPDEVAAERAAAEQARQDFRYSRRWMAETPGQAEAFRAEGRSGVVRLKMPRDGQCQFDDLIRGPIAVDWAREQDHVIQRADRSCLYHLASVVDDHDFQITHVVRAVEHLSNTPRQIFIARGLQFQPPQFAHIPFVAEPGSRTKLSKRKITKYMKNQEFKQLLDLGLEIAAKLGIPADAETFNPLLVEFYQRIGFLPDALVNYLLLLGWSLDDKTELFDRSEMITQFSLDRVVKNEASFDPAKLLSFQARYMNALPVSEKVECCLPFLQARGHVDDPASPEERQVLAQVLQAAGDRIVVGGDILKFEEMFGSAEEVEYDEAAFEKRLRRPPEAATLLAEFRNVLAGATDNSASGLEHELKQFVASRDIKIGHIIHALRVAITGKPVGFGLFDAMALLGPEECLARLDLTLHRLTHPSNTHT